MEKKVYSMKHVLLIFAVPIGLIVFFVILNIKGEGEKKNSNSSSARLKIPELMLRRNLQAAEMGRRVFLKACPLTSETWSSISSTQIDVKSSFGYRKDQFNWAKEVEIQLVFHEDLAEPYSGNHLTFYLGGGTRPGITTSKALSKKLCKFSGRAEHVTSGGPCTIESGEDCILDVPALNQIDAVMPKEIVLDDTGNSKEIAPVVFCFAQGFKNKRFWECTETKKDCRRSRQRAKKEENDDFLVRTACQKSNDPSCYIDENEKVICAPNQEACLESRKSWTDLVKAGPCHAGTKSLISRALKREK